MRLARGRGGADRIGVECFGNGEKGNASRVEVGPAGGVGDALADLREIRSHIRRGRHGYLLVPRIALATSANSPVGASFRYSWNGALASAIVALLLLARLKMAMPR